MNMRCLHTAVLLLLLVARSAFSAGSAPFTQGNARLSLHFGGATAFNQDYSIIGIGGGYYVADGVEMGLDAETWFGNSPRIAQISPEVRLVLNPAGSIKPYLGAFYRRTFIEHYRDSDTVGGRAGIYRLAGQRSYFGAGLALDAHLKCDRAVYTHCAEAYPELLFAVMF